VLPLQLRLNTRVDQRTNYVSRTHSYTNQLTHERSHFKSKVIWQKAESTPKSLVPLGEPRIFIYHVFLDPTSDTPNGI